MRQYAPKIQIIHYGVVSGTGTHTDLADWLGDGCSVKTSKSLRAPMGQFTITVVDKEYPGFADSVYYMVAPMDAIEIKAAHDGRKTPKILMRGFVSDIRRDETLDKEGKPVRRVTIIGHDVGKIFVQQRVYLTPTPKDVNMLMTGWGILIKYLGSQAKPWPVQEYVNKMVDLVDMHLNTLLADSPLKILMDYKAAAEGLIPPLAINDLHDCSLHEHMSRLLDVGVFNEMFVRDDEAGSVLHVRPIFDGENGVTLTEEDVVTESLHRTDADVVNWFWVRIKRSIIQDGNTALMQGAATVAYDWREEEPCSALKYGYRKLEVDAWLFPPAHGLQDSPKLPQVHTNQSALFAWLTMRQETLGQMNCYNALWESGVLKISGNEDVQIGTWLTLNKGNTVQSMYAIGVEHEWVPFVNFSTTVSFERNDSYFKRMGGGQYKAELNLKGALK